jgi:hypothetical protein
MQAPRLYNISKTSTFAPGFRFTDHPYSDCMPATLKLPTCESYEKSIAISGAIKVQYIAKSSDHCTA